MAFTNFKIVESKRGVRSNEHNPYVKRGPIERMAIVTYVKDVFYASIRGSHYLIAQESLEPITDIVYSTPHNGIFENWTPTSVRSAEVFTNDNVRWCSVKPGLLVYGVLANDKFVIKHYGRKFIDEPDNETQQSS